MCSDVTLKYTTLIHVLCNDSLSLWVLSFNPNNLQLNSLSHSLTHSLTHSFNHPSTHLFSLPLPLTQSPSQPLTHSPTPSVTVTAVTTLPLAFCHSCTFIQFVHASHVACRLQKPCHPQSLEPTSALLLPVPTFVRSSVRLRSFAQRRSWPSMARVSVTQHKNTP